MFIVLCIAFVILALILKSYPDVIFNFLIELSSNYYISEIIGTYFRIWFLINSFENENTFFYLLFSILFIILHGLFCGILFFLIVLVKNTIKYLFFD